METARFLSVPATGMHLTCRMEGECRTIANPRLAANHFSTRTVDDHVKKCGGVFMSGDSLVSQVNRLADRDARDLPLAMRLPEE